VKNGFVSLDGRRGEKKKTRSISTERGGNIIVTVATNVYTACNHDDACVCLPLRHVLRAVTQKGAAGAAAAGYSHFVYWFENPKTIQNSRVLRNQTNTVPTNREKRRVSKTRGVQQSYSADTVRTRINKNYSYSK